MDIQKPSDTTCPICAEYLPVKERIVVWRNEGIIIRSCKEIPEQSEIAKKNLKFADFYSYEDRHAFSHCLNPKNDKMTACGLEIPQGIVHHVFE